MFVRKFVHMFVGVFVVRMIFETATFCDLDAAVATMALWVPIEQETARTQSVIC